MLFESLCRTSELQLRKFLNDTAKDAAQMTQLQLDATLAVVVDAADEIVALKGKPITIGIKSKRLRMHKQKMHRKPEQKPLESS